MHDTAISFRRYLLILVAMGFLIRLAHLLYQGVDVVFPDERRFLQEAQSLLASFQFMGNGKVAHDMPLTAITIAIMMKLFGGSLYAPKLFFVIVSSLNIYLIALLAYELSKSERTALLAALISCFYPFFIFYSTLFLSETLFLFFITLIFYLVVKERNQNTVIISVVVGITHLVRPTFLYFYPILLLVLGYFRKMSIKFIVLNSLVFLLIVSPWVIRNYQKLDVFLLTTTSSGQVLWEANNPWNTTGGVSLSYDKSLSYLKEIPEFDNEYETDNYKKQKAIEFISNNPKQFVKNSWKKFKRFWNLRPNSEQHQADIYKIVSMTSFGPVLLFFLVWLVLPGTINRYTLAIPLFVCYYTVIHLVTVSSIRYRLPIEPLMIACASVAMMSVWDKIYQYIKRNI